jgi:nitrile hydratase subunit alpha
LDGFDPAARMKALEQLLVEKGHIQPAALDAMIETYAHGAMNGARVVAKAWGDPQFRWRLLADRNAACAARAATATDKG